MNNKQNVSDDLQKMLSLNERRMNLVVTIVLLIIDVPLIIEILESLDLELVVIVGIVPVLFLSAAIVMNLLLSRHDCPWLKYVNLAVILITFITMRGSDNKSFYIVFILPAFFSSFYFIMRYTIITSTVSIATIVFITFNDLDLSDPVALESLMNGEFSVVIRKFFDFSNISERIDRDTIMLLIFITALICVAIYISYSGRRFYKDQAALIRTTAASRFELKMASGIQNGALSHDFPQNDHYSVYADMTSAAEIGGDFYDFFMVDDTHLAIVVGDVSGHGMAAAMFMMLSKTLIKVYAQTGLSCDKVMSSTNKYLVSSNPEKYFVTAWLGIVDLTNGTMSYTNAGHNYPIIMRAAESPKLLRSQTNFVLGRKRLAKYSENYIKLSQGDRIVLYTDGVTEARSPQDELFGDERLLAKAASVGTGGARQIVDTVREAVKEFEAGQTSYDDVTILCFDLDSFMQAPQYENKKFMLTKESFDEVIDYISDKCSEYGCSNGIVYSIATAASEILANIESYAYENGGEIEISSVVRERRVIIIFRDNGKPFDPLLAAKPDITLPLKQRTPGGLGIFIIQKLMDNVSYRYENGQNVLTIEKDF